MKLSYQVATPDVRCGESVTAYQGSIEKTFSDIASMGYDGVELMTLDPAKLDRVYIKELARQLGISCEMVCTGEIYGQLGLNFTDQDKEKRREAIDRVKADIDFASYLGAKVNIGRVRGHYCPEVPKERTEELAIEAFTEISEYAEPRSVMLALENVTKMQTNFINTVYEAGRMVERVNRPNFRIMMDVFHMNIEEKNMFAAMSDMAGYTVHVHLADNNRKYPGSCGMDMYRVISTLKKAGYDNGFSIEIMQLPNMETAAKRSIEYLAPIFEKEYGRKI